MIKPALDLASWEVPPYGRRNLDEEPFFFDAVCFGKKRTLVGRSINEDGFENILFFTVPEEPQRGHFVCTQAQREWTYSEAVHGSKNDRETLIHRVENQFWGRYFVLDETFVLACEGKGVYTLFLCSTGWGSLECPRSGARFQWAPPSSREFWESTSLDLLSHVVERKNHSDDVGFAFRWMQMTRMEQFDLVYPLQRGTYKEWTDVCVLCLLALDIWKEEWEQHKLEFSVGIEGKVRASWYPRRRGEYKIQEGSAFYTFASWSHSYFAPTRDEALCEQYQWAERWSHEPSSVVRGSLARPSQHERLEALLQLREWLADRAMPAEIKALLFRD